MKTHLLSVLLAGVAASALAYSHIDPASVSWSQERTGVVRVSYTLTGGRAVVLLADVLTNNVSVGSIPASDFSGDVNGVVEPGARSFVWTMSSPGLSESRLKTPVWSFKLDVRNPNRLPDYMAVNLTDGTMAFYASTSAVPGGVSAATWKTTHLLMRRIPAANVVARLGLGVGDANTSSYSYAPPYEHTFEEDYYMAVYEMTQGQYGTLCGAYPSAYGQTCFNSCASSSHKTTHATDWPWHPVEKVSYDSAVAAATALTTRFAAANAGYGFTFALPTEHQWEYACRAGSSKDVYGNIRRVSLNGVVNSIYVNFQKMNAVYDSAGTSNYSSKRPGYAVHIPVGQLTPNAWGLYDMLGNVREWCVPAFGATAVTRGGGCSMSGETMTAACRETTDVAATTTNAYIGFRLVCNLKAE